MSSQLALYFAHSLAIQHLGDHQRGNVRGSQFRKALGQSLKANGEAEISEYIAKNCSFRFLATESFEESVRLEHFTTAIISPKTQHSPKTVTKGAEIKF